MKKFTKIFALTLALALLACCAAAETPLEKIKAAGKLVVGTEATYPPYEYLDGDTYYRTTHARHNLERAQNQWALYRAVSKALGHAGRIEWRE